MEIENKMEDFTEQELHEILWSENMRDEELKRDAFYELISRAWWAGYDEAEKDYSEGSD